MIVHHHALLGLILFGLLALLPWPAGLAAGGLLAVSYTVASIQIVRALRLPVITGREGMLGAPARVLSRTPHGWLVQYEGETWLAICSEDPSPGAQVTITGVEGLKLVVRSAAAGARGERPLSELVAGERRVILTARDRLRRQAAALAAQAARREAAARRALPAHEDLAWQYLLQKSALLSEAERLQRLADKLNRDAARFEALSDRPPIDPERTSHRRSG